MFFSYSLNFVEHLPDFHEKNQKMPSYFVEIYRKIIKLTFLELLHFSFFQFIFFNPLLTAGELLREGALTLHAALAQIDQLLYLVDRFLARAWRDSSSYRTTI